MAMNSKPTFRADFVSRNAAVYATKHWHYSRSMPSCDVVSIGCWEDDQFIGVILFSRGASANIAKPFSLNGTEVCELTRIALRKHSTPVSRMIKIALKLLRKCSPGIRLVVSYTDSFQGHHGGIYQASGWHYIGSSVGSAIQVHGKLTHRRTLSSKYDTNSIAFLKAHVDQNACLVRLPPKHKYVYVLDKTLQPLIYSMSQPSPKKCTASSGGGTHDGQS